MQYPETITFEADGKHTARVVEPMQQPVANQMTVEVEGVRYGIAIGLGPPMISPHDPVIDPILDLMSGAMVKP